MLSQFWQQYHIDLWPAEDWTCGKLTLDVLISVNLESYNYGFVNYFY